MVRWPWAGRGSLRLEGKSMGQVRVQVRQGQINRDRLWSEASIVKGSKKQGRLPVLVGQGLRQVIKVEKSY